MNANAQSQQRFLKTAAAFSVAIALAACQSPADPSKEAQGQAASPQPQSASPAIPYEELEPHTSHDIPEQEEQEDLDARTETSSMTASGNSKPKTKMEQWRESSPALLGISLQDSRSDVINQHGEPIDSYELQDASGNIDVMEYKGYSVGIGSSGTVQFVEVYSSDIGTGITGLRVGDKPEQAKLELGKPEEASDYLLIYQGTGASLRVDIDPKRDQIVALKLVAKL
ncbi:hypothetical protein [Paenibacillus sp. PL2-23]|uniref:hypothetical protein n=1 Tax=Paenibacillus sp. PL2-23 TaxID=2100729 RepID=UPI0030F7D69E